jgi:aldehyde:ferredoxin oxidoreductase
MTEKQGPPYGYIGKILQVDLTNGKLEDEEPPESFYRKYMGGGAMGLFYILKMMPAGVDPLSPDNVMTVMTGVTTGAPISGQSRLVINAKSPMSGAIGDSQSGGYFGPELKFAGYDGIVIRGRSPKPVYLSILHGKVELHDASDLTGKAIAETDLLLREKVGDLKAQVIQYGPGAENGVRFSSIMTMANRTNGRTGMGLVMASKNLKAIVVRGKQRVNIADKELFSKVSKAGPGLLEATGNNLFGELGTPQVILVQNAMGTLPTRNFNEGQYEHAEDISGERLVDTYLKKRDTCYACIVRCKRVVEIKEGAYQVDPIYGGPEYETLSTFGSYCAINDLAALCRAHQICDMYGVDTITCGATIAFAMECYEKGIIGKKETGGIDLRFGNTEAMLQTLQQIVTKSGALGTVLAEGSERAAKTWGNGAEECLITVKGEETPAHMPQLKKSLAVVYAANPFGADHQSSEHDPMYWPNDDYNFFLLARLRELDLKDPQPEQAFGSEVVRFGLYTQRFYSMMDTVALCQFVFGPAWGTYGPSETVDMIKAVTGWPINLYELMLVGERRINMMRVFNAREGFTRKEDKLPAKFFKPLVGTGPTAGVAIDREEFERNLDLYYQMSGWTADGYPTHAKLVDLGIEWAAEYLPA